LKCQNVKMAKWQNDKTPIGLWSEKVRKLLQGLRHYVTYRRQKVAKIGKNCPIF
jgi:hypothetical protein